MLKITRIELEPISDIDMYLFIEKGIIGCISHIPKRYGKSIKKHMKSYDDIKPSKYIMFLDKYHVFGQIFYMVRKWVNLFLTLNQ